MSRKIIKELLPHVLVKSACLVEDGIIKFCKVKDFKIGILTTCRIGKFTLRLPITHMLPVYQKQSPHYSTQPGRIALEIKKKYPSLTCINIGANIGDTIAILRDKASFPILAIEGDEFFYKILEKNISQFPSVYIKRAFLGDSAENIKGLMKRGRGTAAFIMGGKGDDLMSVLTLNDILNEYPAFRDSKLLIIDADGFDCKIIRGAKDWLSDAKPVIFFEYDPYHFGRSLDDGFSIFTTLSLLGYEKIMLYSNVGDYMCSVDINNEPLLRDLHEYFSGRNGDLCYDICVFPREDTDLFDKLRLSEIQFFRNLRGVK